jgi:hypothetical protein
MRVANMIRLDYFTMKPNLKAFGVVILFVVVFWLMSSSLTLLLVNCAWYLALISSNVFAVEEQNGLKRLYGMLPLTTRDRILGRYLFVLLTHVVATPTVLVLSLFVPSSAPVTLDGTLLPLSASLLIYSAIVGAQMPFFFRLGYNKGRFYAMVPFLAVMGIAAVPSLMGDTLVLFTWAINNQNIASVLMFTLGIAILSLSYVVSLLLYKGQE